MCLLIFRLGVVSITLKLQKEDKVMKVWSALRALEIVFQRIKIIPVAG